MAAKKSAFPFSQRAAVQQLIGKCIPVLWSASRDGRRRPGWPEAGGKTGGCAFLEETESEAGSCAPDAAQLGLAPAPPGPVATGQSRQKAEGGSWREAAAACLHCGTRPTAAHPQPPATLSPKAQGLLKRAPPAAGSSPATKDNSTTSTAMVPRRPRQCRATRNGPTRRERPPQHQGVTRSGSLRLLEAAPSSPPLGQLSPSPPIASYAVAGGRGVAGATSAWWSESTVMNGRPCQWQEAIAEPGSPAPRPMTTGHEMEGRAGVGAEEDIGCWGGRRAYGVELPPECGSFGQSRLTVSNRGVCLALSRGSALPSV